MLRVAGSQIKLTHVLRTGWTLCVSRPKVVLNFSRFTVLINEEMTTESQQYNCFTRNGGNAIPKHAGPEAKCSYPTAGLTLLWAGNPFRGNFNHGQVSRK